MKSALTAFVLLLTSVFCLHAAVRTFNEAPYKLPEQFSVRLVFMQQGANGVLQKPSKGLELQMYTGKTRGRIDFLGNSQIFQTFLQDIKTKETITLRRQAKTSYQSSNTTADVIRANFPTGSWQYLGTETLNGKRAEMYNVASRFMFGHKDVTYKIWVDPTTRLPLQGTYVSGPNKDFTSGMSFKYVDFKAGPPSPELLKMTIPSGYKDEVTGKITP